MYPRVIGLTSLGWRFAHAAALTTLSPSWVIFVCAGAIQVSYNGVLSACGNAGEWRAALRVLTEMQEAGISPNSYNYSAASERDGDGGGGEKEGF